MKNLQILIQILLLSSASLREIRRRVRRETLKETHLSRSVGKVSKAIFGSLIEDGSEDSNIVISPTSIHLALSLLYHGSASHTKDELLKFLDYDTIKESYIQNATQKLLKSYGDKIEEVKSRSTIENANTIFTDKHLNIKDSYKDDLAKYLFAEVQQVDYQEPVKSAQEINNWVQKKTRNLIQDLISPDLITDDSKLLLLNAIYFKANWMSNFNKLETVSRPFRVREGVNKNVDIMTQTNLFQYKYNYDFQSQIISLPYQDENFSMIVILPFEEGNEKVNEVINKVLTIPSNLNTIILGMEETEVDIFLPKFKLSYKSELVNVLQKKGLTNLFQNGDFSRISDDEELEVSDIVHETKIEVNEVGSEAAGVTGILLGVRSGPSANVEQMVVDRPFVFVIHDKQNNIPLFIGKIAAPTESVANTGDNLISPVDTYREDDFANVKNSSGSGFGLRGVDLDNSKNTVGVRGQDVIQLLSGLDLDPEDKNFYLNNPDKIDQLGLHVNCTLVSVRELTNTKNVMFPCGGRDTQPIEDYQKKHGDPSLLGVNGEQAALQAQAGV